MVITDGFLTERPVVFLRDTDCKMRKELHHPELKAQD